MQEVIFWPEVMDWREFGRVFLTMSTIAVFVSFLFNYRLKRFSVLAAQLSILSTLGIYPVIDFYNLIISKKEFLENIESVDPSNYGALVFFAPLPVCITVSVIFVVLNAKKAEVTSPSKLDKSKAIVTLFGAIISLFIGTVWLGVNMLVNKESFVVNVGTTAIYTVLGFVMYLFSAAVIMTIKWISSRVNENTEI